MSYFEVAVLASGSKGNATVLRCGRKVFLIDLGISCRRLVKSMAEVGFAPEDLECVFLTHEHSDHTKGLATFLKKYQIPVRASTGTLLALYGANWSLDARMQSVSAPLHFGPLEVMPFAVSHDAREPLGYSFAEGRHKLAYVTDTGYVNDSIKAAVQGAEVLVVEANHDPFMLKHGRYPAELKKRIMGTRGHLNNTAAGWLVAGMKPPPREIFLAHLSQENNTPSMALNTVEDILQQQGLEHQVKIYVTSQETTIQNFIEEDHHEQNIFA
jgi:phosphoribosyl 1,2-cyclic phosphodiesterase